MNHDSLTFNQAKSTGIIVDDENVHVLKDFIFNNPLLINVNELKKYLILFLFETIHFREHLMSRQELDLEKLEKEWNYVGHKRFATYTYINPGTYVFKVIGSNNDGIWNKTPTTLKITILPPFWKTIWAYIFYYLYQPLDRFDLLQ